MLVKLYIIYIPDMIIAIMYNFTNIKYSQPAICNINIIIKRLIIQKIIDH